jgi:hypothetical protein
MFPKSAPSIVTVTLAPTMSEIVPAKRHQWHMVYWHPRRSHTLEVVNYSAAHAPLGDTNLRRRLCSWHSRPRLLQPYLDDDTTMRSPRRDANINFDVCCTVLGCAYSCKCLAGGLWEGLRVATSWLSSQGVVCQGVLHFLSSLEKS